MVYIRETAVFGGISLALPGSAAFGGGKMKYTKFGALRVRHWGRRRKNKSFLKKNFRRAMQILNMCLVLKLDNGKVVYIADEQTDGQTHPVRY